MAEGLNRVMLLGNLGADPELRFAQSGQAVLNMRLACTETYFDKDKNKQERTEWIPVVVWGRRAEALDKILHKGSSVFVEGRLQTSSYEDRDGNKRYKTEVVANNIILPGGRRDGGGEAGAGDGDQEQGSPSGYRRQPSGQQRGGGGYSRGSGGGGRGSAGGKAPASGYGDAESDGRAPAKAAQADDAGGEEYGYGGGQGDSDIPF